MKKLFEKLGITEKPKGASTGTGWFAGEGGLLEVRSPIDGTRMAQISKAGDEEYERILDASCKAFEHWRQVPAPQRGEIVRQIGNRIRELKTELGALISLEVGKIRSEAEGEVQEVIDMCDFAQGQSRMLYGLTTQSERPGHRLYEQWHPLGPIGLITAFNFPMAVPGWNAMNALICGDTLIWKPSSKAPLCAIALCKLIGDVLKENGQPEGIFSLLVGERTTIGERLSADGRLPLISATGSVAMGRKVAERVGARLGRSLLELGGNNAIIVTPSADLSLAIRAILFGAVGTAGQRCTTTRRVMVQESIFNELSSRLIEAYKQVRIGDPRDESTLMGPLIDARARERMLKSMEELKSQGGRILYGGEPLSGGIFDRGAYVTPCIAEARNHYPVVQRETFAPLLYLIRYEKLEEAIGYQNDVPQGLSSSIFSNDLGETEIFLSHTGSDCGLANVNVGTSGAEIGEAGTEAWKNYMRRQTSCINFSGKLPLAQGISFGGDG